MELLSIQQEIKEEKKKKINSLHKNDFTPLSFTSPPEIKRTSVASIDLSSNSPSIPVLPVEISSSSSSAPLSTSRRGRSSTKPNQTLAGPMSTLDLMLAHVCIPDTYKDLMLGLNDDTQEGFGGDI